MPHKYIVIARNEVTKQSLCRNSGAIVADAIILSHFIHLRNAVDSFPNLSSPTPDYVCSIPLQLQSGTNYRLGLRRELRSLERPPTGQAQPNGAVF